MTTLTVVTWIGKSLLILAIFQVIVPAVVDGATRNSWAKSPIMLICAVGAAAFMVWLRYMPYFLFFLWMQLTRHTLQVMTERPFEIEAEMKMDKPVFYVSCYTYVIVACLLAWVFQIQVSTGGSSGPWTPIWRLMLGMK